MEGEDKQVKLKQNLEIFDILKESVTIYFNNINFIIFTFITSLPFFFVMVYFETLFQETLVDTPLIINQFEYELNPYDTVRSSNKDYFPILFQLGFIYLVPLHVLHLCSVVVTIYSASKLRSQDNKLSLSHMFRHSFDISIMKGTLITSLSMLFLSTCFLVAFVWTVGICYTFYKIFGCYILFAAICCVALVKLLTMFLERSAIWNMGIAISVLDGIYGVGALSVSCFFSYGNQKRGLLLMLVFFELGFCLRLLCVYLRCYEGGYGIFVQIGLLSVVNTLKWVSCMIYFSDCKESKMEKKVDVELGKDLQKSDS